MSSCKTCVSGVSSIPEGRRTDFIDGTKDVDVLLGSCELKEGEDDYTPILVNRKPAEDGDDGVYVSFIGRIAYEPLIGPYGNWEPNYKAKGSNDYKTDDPKRAKLLAVIGMITGDRLWSKVTKLFKALDTSLEKFVTRSPAFEGMTLKQNPLVRKGGDVNVVFKLFYDGSGAGNFDDSLDPKGWIKDLLKEAKFDYDANLRPDFLQVIDVSSAPKDIDDVLTDIDPAVFARNDHVVATAKVVPYVYDIKGQVTYGNQLQMQSLVRIHKGTPVGSPGGKPKYKKSFGGPRGPKPPAFDNNMEA